MSAKNRSSTASAPAGEFYRTPAWAVRAVLPHLGHSRNVADLGCGDGAIGDALREAWSHGYDLVGYEINGDLAEQARRGSYDAVYFADVLAVDAPEQSEDLVILNPPFSLAIPFTEVALKMVRPGGIVAVLQREGWLSVQERKAWARAHPCDKRILERRPSFDGTSTDSTSYAWHLFGLGLGGRWSILDCEPGRTGKKGT